MDTTRRSFLAAAATALYPLGGDRRCRNAARRFRDSDQQDERYSRFIRCESRYFGGPL
jgi:hypothetical protein